MTEYGYRYFFNERTWSKWLWIESVDTPNFYTLRSSGAQLPVNEHKYHVFDGKYPEVETYNGPSTERDARGLETFVDAALNGEFGVPGGPRERVKGLDELEVESVNRMDQRLRNIDLDVGVALGEYRETALFVSDSFGRIARSYRDLRRGNWKRALDTLAGIRTGYFDDRTYKSKLLKRQEARRRAKRVRDATSDNWLAYSYGLSPLLNDVHASVRVLDEGIRATPEPITVTATSSGFISRSSSYGPATTHVQGKVKVKAAKTFRIRDPILYSLEQMGVTDPVATAWELIPFSFVVDWCIPVGAWLRGIHPPSGVDYIQGYVYRKAVGTASHSTDIDYEGGWHTSAFESEVYKHRKTAYGHTGVRFHRPDLSLTKGQVASSVALLHKAWDDLGPERISGRRRRLRY